MTDWLSATWEASWRPFQYFNLYRLILAALVLLAALLPEGWIASLHLGYSLPFMLAALAYLAVADTLRASSRAAVQRLQQRGIKVVMLTGDNAATAAVIAREAGIEDFRAGILPAEVCGCSR